jgi:hypothetical protein
MYAAKHADKCRHDDRGRRGGAPRGAPPDERNENDTRRDTRGPLVGASGPAAVVRGPRAARRSSEEPHGCVTARRRPAAQRVHTRIPDGRAEGEPACALVRAAELLGRVRHVAALVDAAATTRMPPHRAWSAGLADARRGSSRSAATARRPGGGARDKVVEDSLSCARKLRLGDEVVIV